jgi:hypothetical protein
MAGEISITQPKKWPVGVAAVVPAYKNISVKMEPIKGEKLLVQLKQMGGFDCSGCACSDPDPLDKRSPFELCDHGAKAVAKEATLKRAGVKFF